MKFWFSGMHTIKDKVLSKRNSCALTHINTCTNICTTEEHELHCIMSSKVKTVLLNRNC